jgi:hypothetical protein
VRPPRPKGILREYFGLPPPWTNDYLAAQAFMTHTGAVGNFAAGSRGPNGRISDENALTMGPE